MEARGFGSGVARAVPALSCASAVACAAASSFPLLGPAPASFGRSRRHARGYQSVVDSYTVRSRKSIPLRDRLMGEVWRIGPRSARLRAGRGADNAGLVPQQELAQLAERSLGAQ